MKTLALIFGGISVAFLGYAVYFDYNRRNNAEFRKALKKKKLEALRVKEMERKSAEDKAAALLKSALNIVANVKYPTKVEERERFFLENAQKGEDLMRSDPNKLDEIAACFFNAVKVYPNPVDLLVVLQKSLPEDIISLVYAMISTEDMKAADLYYQDLVSRFPTVSIDQIKGSKGRAMFAKTKLKQNDVVYTEDPAVTCLTVPALKLGEFCHYCLSEIPSDVLGDPDVFVQGDDGFTVFQSEVCQQRAMVDYLKSFSKDSDEFGKIFDYCVEKQTMYPLMVAKFVGKMISKQMSDGRKQKNQTVVVEWEHLERLPMADLSQLEQDVDTEVRLLCDALKGAAPSIAEFLTVERYLSIKSAIIGNCIGIHLPSESRNKSFSNQESILPRSPLPQDQLHSAGLYFVSSYIRHSDEPNAVIEFVYPHAPKPKKSNIPSPKLVLRALTLIEEGEEITVAHRVPVIRQSSDEEDGQVVEVEGEESVGK